MPIDQRSGFDHGRVLASWRPEAAAIVDPALADASLKGSVELITFLGPITRLDVRVEGDAEPVMVDLPSTAAKQLAIGQQIGLHVPADAIRLFPA